MNFPMLLPVAKQCLLCGSGPTTCILYAGFNMCLSGSIRPWLQLGKGPPLLGSDLPAETSILSLVEVMLLFR